MGAVVTEEDRPGVTLWYLRPPPHPAPLVGEVLPALPGESPAQEGVSVTEGPGGQARGRALLVRGHQVSTGAVWLAGPPFQVRRA